MEYVNIKFRNTTKEHLNSRQHPTNRASTLHIAYTRGPHQMPSTTTTTITTAVLDTVMVNQASPPPPLPPTTYHLNRNPLSAPEHTMQHSHKNSQRPVPQSKHSQQNSLSWHVKRSWGRGWKVSQKTSPVWHICTVSSRRKKKVPSCLVVKNCVYHPVPSSQKRYTVLSRRKQYYLPSLPVMKNTVYVLYPPVPSRRAISHPPSRPVQPIIVFIILPSRL